MRKLWFSIYDFSFDYKSDEPAFTNTHAYTWAAEFETHYEEIKKELQHYLSEHKLVSYFSPAMVTQKDSWQTISLKTWDIELFKVQKHFPYINSVLQKYPEIVSASFSMLKAKSKIVPHCGDTNGVYRCHFGIDVPAGLPECGLKVKGESRAWENGKWFAFMDAYKHEAWNDTDKDRYVFIADVMQSEFGAKQKFVCATVRTSLFLQKRFKNISGMPGFAKIAATILRPFMQMSIFLVNKLKAY